MENNSFGIGDTVIFSPSKETLDFFHHYGIYGEFEKYIGEKAIVSNYGFSSENATIRYLKLPNITHMWNKRDLVLAPTKREFSGEV